MYQYLSRCRSELMGLAILWVMLFHAYPFSFDIAPLDSFKRHGFAGVDVFLLLSAMGLYVSLAKKGSDHFFRRRLIRVMPAYWLVVGLYSLLLLWRGRIGWPVVLWNLSALHYWFQIPGSFNWYVPALLAFYALTPLYVRLFRRCSHPGWLTLAVFPVSYGIYRLSIPLHLNYTEDFVCRMPAFALGVLMGHFLLTDQPLTRRHALVWGAVSLCGVWIMALCAQDKLYISPCYRIASLLVPGCLLAAKALAYLPEAARVPLRLLGESSLEIYLLNVIVTREFNFLSARLDRGPRHLFYYAVVYSLNLALGLLFHQLLSRLPRRLASQKHIPSPNRTT